MLDDGAAVPRQVFFDAEHPAIADAAVPGGRHEPRATLTVPAVLHDLDLRRPRELPAELFEQGGLVAGDYI